MKKNYSTGILVLCVLSLLNAQIPLDNIESYPEGLLYEGPWTTWDGLNGDQNAIVSTDIAASGTKSIKIEGGNTQDVIFNQGINATSGTWSTKWKMFIPKGNSAYFNLQGNATPSAGANLVFLTRGIEFNRANQTPEEGIILDTGETFAFPNNEWFTITVVVYIDEVDVENESYYEVYFNDENIGTYAQQIGFYYPNRPTPPTGAFNGFDAVNFFPIEAASKFYVDDIEFKEGDILNTNNFSVDTFSVFPNPVKDILTINTTKNTSIKTIHVYNMTGKLILKTSPNSKSTKIDMNTLSSGLYLVKATSDNGASKTIKVTK